MTRAEPELLIPDNPNWRRHKNACVFYRERWSAEEELGDDGCVLLYQIICLQGTPPLDAGEQDKCMRPRTTCWRNPAIKCTRAAAEAAGVYTSTAVGR